MKVMIKRFLTFVESIKSSKKIALKNLFKVVKEDCRSVTGKNLARIMNLVGKENVDCLVPSDAMDIQYHVISEENVYKVNIIKELTDVKFGESFVAGFSRKELDMILNNVCTVRYLLITCSLVIFKYLDFLILYTLSIMTV